MSEGDEILVPLMSGEPEAVTLLVADNAKIKLGTPEVKGVRVELKKLEDIKGKKLYVAKFKAKSRYRRRIGFRPKYTKLQVKKID